jgi:hypothetical protein
VPVLWAEVAWLGVWQVSVTHVEAVQGQLEGLEDAQPVCVGGGRGGRGSKGKVMSLCVLNWEQGPGRSIVRTVFVETW